MNEVNLCPSLLLANLNIQTVLLRFRHHFLFVCLHVIIIFIIIITELQFFSLFLAPPFLKL